MSFTEHTCVSVTCDGCEEPLGHDDGITHFGSRDEAIAYATNSIWGDDCRWVFTSDRAICSSCARKADCAATGHQWDVWRDGGDVAGVPYRTRWCDHCGDTEYDPPFGALVLFRRLAEDASAD